jgi:hypothetical protein
VFRYCCQGAVVVKGNFCVFHQFSAREGKAHFYCYWRSSIVIATLTTNGYVAT